MLKLLIQDIKHYLICIPINSNHKFCIKSMHVQGIYIVEYLLITNVYYLPFNLVLRIFLINVMKILIKKTKMKKYLLYKIYTT